MGVSSLAKDLLGLMPMFTFSILTIVILALVLGIALGMVANGDDKKLLDAKTKIDDLRSALLASRLECIEQRMRYEKRITASQETISDYEAIFDEQENRKQSTRSAVILPFKSP